MNFNDLLEIIAESREVLDRQNYPFPYKDLEAGQYIGDLFGGAKVRAVYKLLAPSVAIELPNKAGPGAITYRIRAERIDQSIDGGSGGSFEGGTHKENFVVLTPEQAQQCINRLHEIEAQKEPSIGVNHADMTAKSNYGKEAGL